MEHRVVGRVQVLGAIVRPQRPRPEPEHPAALVAQREHDAPAEAVDQAAPVAPLDRQPARDQLVAAVARLRGSGEHPFVRTWREPDPELAQRPLLQAPRSEVRAGGGRLGRLPQHPHVVGGRALEQCAQPVISLRGAPRSPDPPRLALELDPAAVGERLQRTREVEPLGLHHEREDVAARAAAEAVVELLDRVDPERRRPLVVERAQPGQPSRARAPQLRAGADQLLEVDRIPDPLARVLRVASHQIARPCGTKRSVQARIA